MFKFNSPKSAEGVKGITYIKLILLDDLFAGAQGTQQW